MFTPGNILTIGICLLLVILFRQMDKSNRSIEKVKKFGDKLKNDLDIFIKERTAQLNDASVGLEVQQTKAVAAVRRLDSIREELSTKEEALLERTQAVNGIEKRIAEYDHTLKQLMDMTRQAEINLERIASESNFTDMIGKQLSGAQKQLDDLTAGIPALREQFAQDNRADLASAQSHLFDQVHTSVSALEHRVETIQHTSGKILETATEKLQELLKKAFTEASRRADILEDAAFAKLKEQAQERLTRYKETIEEKTAALHDSAKEKISDTQHLLKAFKSEWQTEARDFLEATRSEIAALDETSRLRLDDISGRLEGVDRLTAQKAGEIDAALKAFEKKLTDQAQTLDGRLEQEIKRSAALIAESTAAIHDDVETEFAAYKKDVDYRLGALRILIDDTDRLEDQLRAAMAETESRVKADFSVFTDEQTAGTDAFAGEISERSAVLVSRMESLEAGLNELKSKAYANVSEKLKMFEDDFFADLAKRSDSVNTALTAWKQNVDERLETLTSDSESGRKDLETAYTLEMKARLQAIAEQFRENTARVEEQMQEVEGELRGRITSSDHSLQTFMEQIKVEFAEIRGRAESSLQNELATHALSIQETMRKQERDLDTHIKALNGTVDSVRNDSLSVIDAIKADFAAWKNRSDLQYKEASEALVAKLSNLDSTTAEAIAGMETLYRTEYKSFIEKASADRVALQHQLEVLGARMTQSAEDFESRSGRLLSDLSRSAETLTSEHAQRLRELSSETEQTVRTLKGTVQDVRDKLEAGHAKLAEKIQNDTTALSHNLDEVDRRQKAFVAQTRVFDRADELKKGLEGDIDRLKDEIGRLDVYRETMNTLEQQYGKIRKLEDETSQKLSRFIAEKKRIDILEADFTKLLGLSDSIDRKISELTLTNDDLQQYQVQIRRFEDSISEVNTRYERLDKKAAVLDQTVTGVDKAFEELKTLEGALKSYRENAAGLPEQLSQIRSTMDLLMENRERTAPLVEKLSSLDLVLEDVEKRVEKMQTAREWLARTETRLEEISKQSQDQLKLMGDLLKEESPARKTKGAPPIGIRENVVKLAHQGWKVDEIARALHLSRGEVELILELPQK